MTLTEASYWSRRAIVIVFIIIFIVGVLILIFSSQNKTITTIDYIKPDYACSELAKDFTAYELKIPSLQIREGSVRSFTIDTPTGMLDAFPGVVNVYKYNIKGQSLNAQTLAKGIAEKLGYDPDKIKKTPANYSWEDKTTATTLVIGARNLDITMSTDFTKTNSYPTGGVLPTDSEAKSKAVSILQSTGVITGDYFKVEPIITYINIDAGGELSMALSRDEAELIKVDFVRRKAVATIREDLGDFNAIKKAWDEKPGFQGSKKSLTINGKAVDAYEYSTIVATQNPNSSNVVIYIGPDRKIGGSSYLSPVYKMNIKNYPIADTHCGTYSLLPLGQAIEILKNGGGSLVYLNVKNGDTVIPYQVQKVSQFVVQNVVLAYYDDINEQPFLQPIYIFYGEAILDGGTKGDFIYYVSAVDYSLVKDSGITQE